MRQPRIPWSRLFAEFAVIVLGVTVALLADEWRAGRMDRETERVLLGRLATDLRTDIETAGRVIESAAHVVEVSSELLQLLEDPLRHHYEPTPVLADVELEGRTPELPPAESFRRAIVALLSFEPRRETFDEMLTTGTFRVIRQPALRDALSRYYRDVERRRDRLVEISPHPIWTALDAVKLDARELAMVPSPLEMLASVDGIEFTIRSRRFMADSRARNVDLVRTEAQRLLEDLIRACGEGCVS